MQVGLEDTIQVLGEYPDLDVAVPVAASALEEPEARELALTLLLEAPHPRAAREIIRRFHFLGAAQRERACILAGNSLLRAAQQLARSNRAQTRLNVVEFAGEIVEGDRNALPRYLPLLIQLVDDPQEKVRTGARLSFLRNVQREARLGELPRSPRDRVLQGLSILLHRYDQHGDPDVIRTLFAIGSHGHDLLGRALGERWSSRDAIHEVAREELDEEGVTSRVEGLFRILRSPFPASRDDARRLLRGRIDAVFLTCCARRLESEEAPELQQEHPTYRHLRWDLTPKDVLRSLDRKTLLRVAGYLQSQNVPPEEKASRIASLLPICDLVAQRDVLNILRELPTDEIVDAVRDVLDSDDEETQRLATDLISLKAGAPAHALLIRQLRSSYESVRTLAQRRLSGHGLEFFFDSFDQLDPEERRQSLAVLRRVDLHFFGQLRRALRSSDENTVVRALRTVLELDEVAPIEDGLFDLTVSPNPRIRASLARALGRTTGDPELHYLRLFLSDPDPRVVANSVETLSHFDSDRARGWLEGLRLHENSRVRCNALLVLGRRGDEGAKAELQQLALPGTSSSGMRTSAVWALERLDSDRGF